MEQFTSAAIADLKKEGEKIMKVWRKLSDERYAAAREIGNDLKPASDEETQASRRYSEIQNQISLLTHTDEPLSDLAIQFNEWDLEKKKRESIPVLLASTKFRANCKHYFFLKECVLVITTGWFAEAISDVQLMPTMAAKGEIKNQKAEGYIMEEVWMTDRSIQDRLIYVNSRDEQIKDSVH